MENLETGYTLTTYYSVTIKNETASSTFDISKTISIISEDLVDLKQFAHKVIRHWHNCELTRLDDIYIAHKNHFTVYDEGNDIERPFVLTINKKQYRSKTVEYRLYDGANKKALTWQEPVLQVAA